MKIIINPITQAAMKLCQVLLAPPLVAVLLHLLLPLLLLLPPAASEDDIPCLRAFKEAVTDPGNYLAGWNLDNASAHGGSVCSFTGVSCWNNLENKVLSLKLPGAGLSGALPSASLTQCLSLTTLDLSGNAFSGSVPTDICTQLKFVTNLDLSNNKLTGQIPDTLGDCEYLNSLHLQENQFTGNLPWSIGLLPRLADLDVSSNSLTGLIPSSYTNRTAIGKVSFGKSAFEGNPGLCGPPLSKSCSSGPNTAIIVGVVLGAAAIVALLLSLGLWWILLRAQKKDRALLRDEHKWAKRIRNPKSITVSLFVKPLVRLKFSDLMVATNDFSKEKIMASSRSGTVYQAFLPDGSMLAIKKLCPSTLTEQQFKSEMSTVGELRHRNLVPLLGYCIAGGERLLVYKHMINGSLRDCLHELPEKSKPDWTTRLRIAIGAARGLAWLHHSCNPRIIHRNISSTSILLDDEYEARITDFVLARLMNPVDTHISTYVNMDLGEIGYVAPEYARTRVATVKGDVYSFGIVLLELVTGQKAVEVCAESGFKGNLADWIGYLSNNGRVTEAIDMSLKGLGADDELNQFLKVACACILFAPKDRPTMYEVYQLLVATGQKFDISDSDDLPMYTEPMNGNYTE